MPVDLESRPCLQAKTAISQLSRARKGKIQLLSLSTRVRSSISCGLS